jgi:hypothetical protein
MDRATLSSCSHQCMAFPANGGCGSNSCSATMTTALRHSLALLFAVSALTSTVAARVPALHEEGRASYVRGATGSAAAVSEVAQSLPAAPATKRRALQPVYTQPSGAIDVPTHVFVNPSPWPLANLTMATASVLWQRGAPGVALQVGFFVSNFTVCMCASLCAALLLERPQACNRVCV